MAWKKKKKTKTKGARAQRWQMDGLLQAVPEQEVTRWGRDGDEAHVQELGSVWTWLPAEGTQSSEQGRGTFWERNALKLTQCGDGALQLLCH